VTVGGLDLAILVGYLAGVLVFGLWVGRRSDSAADYMVGQRDFPWWLVLASIVATETSTVTFLSIPGFAFGRDLTWLQIPLGFLIGRVAVAYLMLPRYFEGTFTSAYQVLAQRFGGRAQRAASLLFVLTRTLADGLRLFLTAIVLQEMTGMALPWAVAAVGLTTVLYTYAGGMRAVLWTDLVQFAIYVGGALLAFWVLLDRLPGGFDGMWRAGEAAGKLRLWDLRFDLAEPYTLWAGILGGAFVTLGSHGVDQMMVQRYFCAGSVRNARKALIGGGFVIVAQFALFLLIGVALWAFYQQHPPAAAFERTDRVFARFILEEMPRGTVGLLLGAIFAAAMSTLSSSLNSCATAVVSDLRRKPRPSPAAATSARDSKAGDLRAIRAWTAFFGLAQIAVGIGGQWLQSTVVASVLGIAAFTTGIVLGIFFLGLFTRRVGEKAALAALLTGFAAMTAVYSLTPLAWPWFALVGSGITFGAGLLASLVWAREATEGESGQ